MRHLSLAGYEYPFGDLAFAPDGGRLFGNGVLVRACWNLDFPGDRPRWHDFGPMCAPIALSPCGGFLAGAEDRDLCVWTLRGDRKPLKPRWLPAETDPDAPGEHITDVAFTPDGAELLTCVINGGVKRWRVGTWERLTPLEPRHRLAGRVARFDDFFAVHPSGKMVATSHVQTGGDRRTGLRTWTFPGGRPLKSALCPPAVQLRYSPCGRFLAGVLDWRSVGVWDARTLAPLADHRPKVGRGKRIEQASRVAWHPSGRWLAATGCHGRVDLLDAATWRVARSYDWGLGNSYGVAFRPDGALAAAGFGKGRAVVWDFDA